MKHAWSKQTFVINYTFILKKSAALRRNKKVRSKHQAKAKSQFPFMHIMGHLSVKSLNCFNFARTAIHHQVLIQFPSWISIAEQKQNTCKIQVKILLEPLTWMLKSCLNHNQRETKLMCILTEDNNKISQWESAKLNKREPNSTSTNLTIPRSFLKF